MCVYLVEKTLRKDGSESVVLVNENYEIVEPVALFLEYLEKRGRALNTIESYCRGLKEYFTWLSKENINFYEVTRRDMLSWMEFIKTDAGRKEKKSARTINKYLAIVASFYSLFEGIGGYIEENPIKKVNNIKNAYYQRFKVSQNQISVNFFRQKETKRKNTQRLFQNEINKLYKGIEQLTKDKSLIIRNQLLFRVLYETGCRISEVLGLRIKDFSEPNPTDDIGTIYIRRHFPLYHNDHSIKTNKRDIPVSMDLIYEIDEYLCNVRPQKNDIDTIFVNHSSSSAGKYMVRSSIEDIFVNLSNVVGIKCTPHMLRHTHGTELKEGGYNQVYIMDRLGHNSVESTNKYMHISFEAQAEAYHRYLKRKGELNEFK